MVDFRIELIILPVSDVDRARAFYGDTLGWPVDHDQTVSEEIRFVQVTPPGSAASVAFGKGLSEMTPGSLRAIQVVVGLRRRRARGPERSVASTPRASTTSRGGASCRSPTPTATRGRSSSCPTGRPSGASRLPPALRSRYGPVTTGPW